MRRILLTSAVGVLSVAFSPLPIAQAASTPPTPAAIPRLAVEVVNRALSHTWDIGFLPNGKLLVTQRSGQLLILSGRRAGARKAIVRANLSDLYAQGEAGLMGLVLHLDFAKTRLFTTCMATKTPAGRAHDVRLVTWRLSADEKSAARVKTLLTGIPLAAGGRHSGCRPTIARDGSLIVGTGDSANARVPQSLTSLGGKTLRLNLKTGAPAAGNPFLRSANPRTRYIYTYGHRNVQGVAVRTGSVQVFSAEHGPDRTDEVNRLLPGRNYGWDPSRGGRTSWYDESVPMTDTSRFPTAVRPVWTTGSVTWATSGAAFLAGRQWGGWNGAMVVACLKESKLVVLRMRTSGAVYAASVPAATNGTYGRLRAARMGPDGALYVASSNGSADVLLRITPTY